MNKELIRAAAEKVGGIVALAARLGITKSAVSQWDRVPAEHVLRVSELTGVSVHELRPDVFGPTPVKHRAAPRAAAQEGRS
jgi:DNA-binding transcriptional regulator YdaS (Cro superfamily)